METLYQTVIHTKTDKQYITLVKTFALHLGDDEWEAVDSESRTLILYGEPARLVADAIYLEGYPLRGYEEIIEVEES